MWDLIVLVPDHCLSIYFGAQIAMFRMCVCGGGGGGGDVRWRGVQGIR